MSQFRPKKTGGLGRTKTHGMKYTRVYKIWGGMKERCSERAKEKDRINYFSRGIRVCDRWLKFENFLSDMGDPPNEMQLDRINNDGNYEPENCRWATREQQGRNKRTNRYIEFRGERKLAIIWAQEMNIEISKLWKRILSGWSSERALLEP